MKIIGITGGVGAGKSTVLQILTELTRCRIIMADDVAKDLMQYGHPLSSHAIALFGQESYTATGALNTGYMAEQMYGNPSLKIQWEALVHPAVKKAIQSMIADYAKEDLDYIFIEAALLIEDHYEELCQEFWYIYANADMRAKRLMADRGYSPEKIQRIFDSQSTEAVFRAHCSFVVDTGISLEATREQLEHKLNSEKEM